MKKDLLICIAFHYSQDRIKWLTEVYQNIFNTYKCSFDIIIDTNTFDIESNNGHPNTTVFVHENQVHPFHLTWQHRAHIKHNIDNYENFMYVEDDMLVPFENYKNYLENFKIMFPKCVPGFVRIEEANRYQFISDVPEHHRLTKENVIEINGRLFTSFKFPHNYHAFWIMPAKELKETLHDKFVMLSDGREFAASYPNWQLQKQSLVEIFERDGKYYLDEKCYSYHLPNNYALSEGSPNGKIKPENIFI